MVRPNAPNRLDHGASLPHGRAADGQLAPEVAKSSKRSVDVVGSSKRNADEVELIRRSHDGLYDDGLYDVGENEKERRKHDGR